MSKNSGYIVETKNGKKGRTYHSKGLVNGKVPVYLIKEYTSGASWFVQPPDEYYDKAILCDPETLKQIGFID